MLDETKCDAIMIGRGLLGNPWLIKNTIAYLEGKEICKPTDEDKINMALHHLDYLKEFKNEKVAALEIRNHIAWYLKGINGANVIKDKIYKTTDINTINKLLIDFKENIYGE